MAQMNNGMKSSEFREFFIDELKDIYWAEKHLNKSLVKLRKAATSKSLEKALDKHHKETEQHIQIVEHVFDILGEKAQTKKCDAMEGILKEANSVIEDTEKDTYTRDAALILAAQKAEHYEIATYGTLVVFARHMGEDRVVEKLQKILNNEKDTDVSLTVIAENYVNERAAME